jgi:hypothetical protein
MIKKVTTKKKENFSPFETTKVARLNCTGDAAKFCYPSDTGNFAYQMKKHFFFFKVN